MEASAFGWFNPDAGTRESPAIHVARKLKVTDVIDVLAGSFILRGIPTHNRSDNGPEFVAETLRDRIAAVGARTAYIEPGPWENEYVKSFNGKLRKISILAFRLFAGFCYFLCVR